MKLHPKQSGCPVDYIEGSPGYNFQNNIVFLSLKTYFVLTNSADPDETLHYAAFHLGLCCLSKKPFGGFGSKIGLMTIF